MDLTKDQEAYIEACRSLRKREQRERQFQIILIVALFASIMALVVAGYYWKEAQTSATQAQAAADAAKIAKDQAVEAKNSAVNAQNDALSQKKIAEDQKKLADEQATIALSGSLAAQAESIKNDDHALALLLGVEAYDRGPSLLTRTTLFQLLQYTPFKRIFGFNGIVSSVAISPDGKWIAVASCRPDVNNQCTNQGYITLFNEKLESRNISGSYGIVYSMAFHQYSNKLVLAAGGCVPKDCSQDAGQITFWEITAESPTLIKQGSAHTGLVKTVAFNPTGTLLASGSYDTTILLWDVSNLDALHPVGRPLDHASFVNGVSFSPDGTTLAAAGDDRTIYLWNITNIENIPEPILSKQHQGPVESVAFAPSKLKPSCADGSVLASAGDDNLVYLWDWCPGSKSLKDHFPSDPSKPFVLQGHTGYVTSISFNADGTMLASTGFDNKIILWDTSTGQRIGLPLSVHTKAINGVAFGSMTSDGTDRPFLVSVSDDRTIITWDLSTFNPLSRSSSQLSSFPGTEKWTPIKSGIPVTTFDNLTMKFIKNDQIVTIETDNEYLKLTGSDSLIDEMYFDGQHLVTKDQNGYFVQWIIDPKEWVKKACEAAKRNLTPDEWNQYLPNQTPQPTCPGNP